MTTEEKLTLTRAEMSAWNADRLADRVLARRHRQEYNGTSPRWIWFKELSVRTSFNPQRIDLWVMDTWGRMNAIAYEVKVSRGDFARELANPAKREAAMAVSNQFYFAAPGGLIAPAEVPEGCGLVEVRGEISTVVVPAPRREIPPPGWEFLAAVGRRGFRLVREFPEVDPNVTASPPGSPPHFASEEPQGRPRS